MGLSTLNFERFACPYTLVTARTPPSPPLQRDSHDWDRARGGLDTHRISLRMSSLLLAVRQGVYPSPVDREELCRFRRGHGSPLSEEPQQWKGVLAFFVPSAK